MARSQSKAPLSLTHPKLAKEAYGWEADTVTFGSSQRKKWKCSKDHIWKATVAVRAIGGNGCPYCSNRKVLKGFNDLVTTHPEIASILIIIYRKQNCMNLSQFGFRFNFAGLHPILRSTN